MRSSGDEIELYAIVSRKFRHLFAKQENMRDFHIYDSINVRFSF
jgi:hypothetical protein